MLTALLLLAMSAETAPAPAAATEKPSDTVCRREKSTGTRFERRRCRKRADIEARAERDIELMREMRSTGVCDIASACGGAPPPK